MFDGFGGSTKENTKTRPQKPWTGHPGNHVMRYSSLPFWLQVAFGVFNALLASICIWLWWPKKKGQKKWLWIAALYFFLFWLYMGT
jgi:hypothetical protein